MSPAKKLFAALLMGAVVSAGCVVEDNRPPSVIVDEPILHVTNDLVDSVDVYIDGVFMDFVRPLETHSYGLDFEGVHTVQVTLHNDPNYILNEGSTFFAFDVITDWSVYENVPLVQINNDFLPGTGECVNAFTDFTNDAVEFTLEDGSGIPATAFDVCPTEAGFFILNIGTHTVEVTGSNTGFNYITDTRGFGNASQTIYSIPTP